MTSKLNAWAKTRSEHLSETAEDYVEAILRLSGEDSQPGCEKSGQVRTADLVRLFEVSQPTVSKILLRLELEGLVCIHRRQSVHLTEKGVEMARRSLERHALVSEFLCALGVSAAQAERDTEGIEHHVSEETLAAMRRFVDRQTEG